MILMNLYTYKTCNNNNKSYLIRIFIKWNYKTMTLISNQLIVTHIVYILCANLVSLLYKNNEFNTEQLLNKSDFRRSICLLLYFNSSFIFYSYYKFF